MFHGEHKNCSAQQLAWYVNHTLSMKEREAVKAHLEYCSNCQHTLAELSAIRSSLSQTNALVPQPRNDLLALVEAQIESQTPRARIQRALHISASALNVLLQHSKMQYRIVRRDLLWMPLLIVPLSLLVLVLPHLWLDRASMLAFGAALITAAGIALLYGQEADPAREMTLVAPTSPRFILAVRCCIIFSYDLFINLLGMLPLLLTHATITPTWFLANWLAPLCCLAGISLFVSTLINPAVAIFTCTLLWVLRAANSLPLLQISVAQQQYESFWHQTPLLYAIAMLAVLLTFLCFKRKEHFLI